MWSVTVTGDVALKFLSLGRVRLCCRFLSPPRSRSVCLSLSCDSLTGDLLSPVLGQSLVMLLSPLDLARRYLSVDSFPSYPPVGPFLSLTNRHHRYRAYAMAPTGRLWTARALVGTAPVAAITLGSTPPTILAVLPALCDYRCNSGLREDLAWVKDLPTIQVAAANALLGNAGTIGLNAQITKYVFPPSSDYLVLTVLKLCKHPCI